MKTKTVEPYEVLHQKGIIFLEQDFAKGAEYGDIGIQIARDGRIWMCLNGQALVRFKPTDHNPFEKDGEQPYQTQPKTVVERFYNPYYGDHRICKCGHTYYRHFDSWEAMRDVGCKYCPCYTFEEDPESNNCIKKKEE